MTREEAIDIVKCLAWHTRPDEEDVEQAMKALEQEPCEDAISRQAVLDLAEWFDLNKQHFTVANLIDEVENIPSVTPKPKMGRWIKSDAVLIVRELKTDTSIKLPAEECSVCHKPHIRGYGKQFCPNCGAKMAESEDTE